MYVDLIIDKKYQKSKAAPVYPDGIAGTVFNYLFLNLWIFCLCFFIRCKLERDKKMQKRRKASRRRTSVRQRRFSAVEKAKTLFRLLKESARIPTHFPL